MMANYRNMYYYLFNQTVDTIAHLQAALREAEEMYISAAPEPTPHADDDGEPRDQ